MRIKKRKEMKDNKDGREREKKLENKEHEGILY